jgi:hypothetical protein
MVGKLCEFIVDRIPCRREMREESRGDLIALRIFQCPLGHRAYEVAVGTDHPISFRDIRFRQALNGDTWHFSMNCSQWPVKNFSSISYISGDATICNECQVKGRGYAID